MSTIGAIDKGIPIPPKPETAAFGATAKYPFDDMEPGDSFPVLPVILEPRVVATQTPEGGTVAQTVPGDDAAAIKKKVKALYVNVSSALKRYREKDGNGHKRFEVRKLEKGVRVWRVEDAVVVEAPAPTPPVTPASASASVPAPPAPSTAPSAAGKKGK